MRYVVIVLLMLPCVALADDALAKRLSDRLSAAGIKSVGVSIGKVADKRTWRIDFAKEATDDDRAAAKATIEAWDVTAESSASRRADCRAKLYRERALLDAMTAEVALRPDDKEMLADVEAQKALVEKCRKDLDQ